MNQIFILIGQCVVEFFGIGLFIFFGVGCVVVLWVVGVSFGQWEISIIWGFGVVMVIYLMVGVFGVYLNLVVIIVLWLFVCFECCKVLLFIVVQMVGVFCVVVLVYGFYCQLFFDFEQSQYIVCGIVVSFNLVGVFFMYLYLYIIFI